jgi:predicted transcriptional regulator
MLAYRAQVPTPSRTPVRSVRVPDDLWRAAQQAAQDQGETVSEVIVRALDQYARSGGWQVDPVTLLERLAALHASGVLPDAEWAVKRRELLSRI